MKRLKDILLKILFKDNVVNWELLFRLTVVLLFMGTMYYLIDAIVVISSL